MKILKALPLRYFIMKWILTAWVGHDISMISSADKTDMYSMSSKVDLK